MDTKRSQHSSDSSANGRCEIIYFEYVGSRLLGDLEFISEGDIKRVELSILNRKIFVLKSKWILVSAITGYTNESELK